MIKRALMPYLKGYIIFLLCVILLLVPFYTTTLSLFEQRQLTLMSHSLQEGLTLLSHQFTTLISLSSSMYSNNEWRIQARKSYENFTAADHYRISEFQKEFKRLCLAQPYISSCGILMNNRIYITDNRIYFPHQEYYDKFIRFGELTLDEFQRLVFSVSGRSCFLPEMDIFIWEQGTSGTSYRGIVWLCNLSQSVGMNPSAVFVVTLSEDLICSLLMPGMSPSDVGIELYANDGTLLLTAGLDKSGGKHTLEAEVAGGLKAALRISDTLFVRLMNPVRHLLLICLLIVVLLGISIAVLLAFQSSRPLQRLELLAKQYQGSAHEKKDSSFDIIQQTVMSLASSVEDYRRALSLQQMSLREYLFDDLLANTFVTDGATFHRMENEVRQAFPDFPPAYRIAILHISENNLSDSEMQELAKMRVSILGLAESILSPVPYIHFRSHNAVMLLDSNCEIPWMEQLSLFHSKAMESFGIQLCIALSEEASGFWQLHTLYSETLPVLRMAERENANSPIRVWCRSNFPDTPNEYPMDYSALTQLHQLLGRADKEGAISLIRNIKQSMMTMTVLEEVISRQVYYNLRGVLLRMKIEKLDILCSVDIPDYSAEVPLNELFEQLIPPCGQICDFISASATETKKEFAMTVCTYIDENISNGNLGEKTVAEHFGISGPTLQKLIRQVKDTSFFDYVDSRRYSCAIRLLSDTDLPIAEISEQCGYNSINSFYKAFRRRSDTTPSAYRQQYQKEHPSPDSAAD